ncbi:orotate phosphoribosyltransferase [Cupriavidus sp. TA19]|nr:MULTISPECIES: orotate phosphoribosyltransferase [unclassified Cupriavidus]BDB22842.1 orotate phosphoribosyltransferase [Cupriavidus sp. P-10]GLC96278.1 orotate phosphoribosyltransferase [Cupriavidus sp. TA19]
MMTQQNTPAALSEGMQGTDLSQTFIRFALDAGVLSFGEFVTKAGRKSPYFFNAGLFNQGAMLGEVAQFYAKTLLASGVQFDVLFGPAYKGITLASATAVALAGMGRDVGFAYNRKEAKDHGEGGTLVGARLQGKVVIVDDVISAGTSVRESVNLIRAAGAEPAAVLIALDRMEKSGTAEQVGTHSAVQDVQREFGIPVIAIASLKDLLAYLDASQDQSLATSREAVSAYRQRYGV